MKKRDFLKTSAALASTTLLPSSLLASLAKTNNRLRTAHIGVGGMGAADLASIASHQAVDVVALCDVDSKKLKAAHELYPKAKMFKDYRLMLSEMASDFDAVIVSKSPSLVQQTVPNHALLLLFVSRGCLKLFQNKTNDTTTALETNRSWNWEIELEYAL